MPTPSTVATYALNNVQKDFDVTFDYLSQTFVQVSLIGTVTQVLTLGSDYTFLSPTTIRTTLAYGPPDWSYIEVRRVTSTTERLVEFNDASVLHANELNLSDLQVIHIAEEARNSATETIGVDNNGNLDARGRRLVNVADPVDLGDAVTIRWYNSEVDSLHTDRLAAEAAKVDAEAAAAAALVSQNGAASSAVSASNSASSASASSSSASSSASSALAYRDAALVYRNEAETFKNSASSSASAAAASESAAATSEANAAASAASINDANLVHKTGDETVGGIKTFTSSPVLPGDATAALQAVPKQQVEGYFSTRGWLASSALKTAAQLNVTTLVPGSYAADSANSSTLGLPASDHYIEHTSYSTNFAKQVAVNFYDAAKRYTRICNAGSWGSWVAERMEYYGPATAMTGGALTNFTHGLGAIPKSVTFELVCLTAEFGYSIGDIIEWYPSFFSTGAEMPSVTKTSTQVQVRLGTSAPKIANKATGASQTITVANWNYRVRAST